MSKVSAGGGKQGKSGKSRSKGSGADIVSSRTESLATSRNTGVVTLLRKALRNDDGTERDLLAELPSFTKYARNGLDLAIEFKVGKGKVIKGWDVGVPKMSLGEKALLFISADYAYGAQGAPPKIPPNADLKFEVELLKVTRAAGETAE